ncbi:hypothetical protein [Chryseobacterium sp.]|uniref:hypothetical protein n=1 Tax=Chryseobacterium sp. TaxID=1871047 RepID=UPI0025C642B0|nr:hypothetical protein [Chryseobacterium sp.]
MEETENILPSNNDLIITLTEKELTEYFRLQLLLNLMGFTSSGKAAIADLCKEINFYYGIDKEKDQK